MRLLFFTNIPSPYRTEFLNKMNKKIEVEVIFDRKINKDRNPKWQKENQFDFKYIFSPSKKHIRRKLNEYVNDIIVVTNYTEKREIYALLYMKKYNIKYFLEIDGGIIKKDNFFKKKLKCLLIQGADGYISPSKESDNYLVYYGASLDRIFRYSFTSINASDIIPNTIDNNQKIKIKKDLGITGKNIVLSIGQFIPRKGFDLLIKASKNFSCDTEVYIVGGEANKEYSRIINENNLSNIHFIEFLSKDELNKYYNCSDVFILPTREDIWGLVINEAMAHGLPIITTNKCVAGLELIKNNVNGYIIPINSIEEIYQLCNKILSDNKLKIKMADNNLKKIRQYTIENMVDEHIQIFEGVIL